MMTLELNRANGTEKEEEVENEEGGELERGNWTGRFDFLLSLLGYSVGLGNVWRFPYLCYNNGGGAFLIPFTIMLIIAGLPLMFMELSFGQYAALGPVAVYNRFCPLFRGLGYGMVIVSTVVMLYYNLIIAWTLHYMFVSFKSISYYLPWQNCDAEWSTEHCYSYEEANECESRNGTYYLRQCYNHTYAQLHEITALAEKVERRPPAEEYFTNQVLGLSAGIEHTGSIRWDMALCLFVAWLIVFLCLCKGVKSSGKVVYFTALFPYVVLVILFFRGVTLPGAWTGIVYYLTPDFSRLYNAQVWGDAAVQIFFALSPAWGGLITLSSYNKFTNNCYKDSLIVAASNIGTSFFAGLVIFSVIGFLANELDVEVDKVVDQGAGLAFIVYPEVVTRLPISPLWSILFFVMLLTLGLDSQFALMETVTTAILDRFPNLRQRKFWVVLAVAVFGYLGGLIFTTNSGMYWLQLMDKYAANWSVLIIAIGECVLIAWIYGAEKFCKDIQQMIGRQSRLWVFFWSAMWRVITPAALVFILAFNWIEYKPARYGAYVYPMWADAVGWAVGLTPVVVVVLMAVDQICSGPDDLTIMEASHDGGDNTSLTNSFDIDFKRAGAVLIKSTKRSFKRKTQSFSQDSDDVANEPLIKKESNDPNKHSAKTAISNINEKSKTDEQNYRANHNGVQNKSFDKTSPVTYIDNDSNSLSTDSSKQSFTKSTVAKVFTSMSCDIDGTTVSKSDSVSPACVKGYNPSPLIFTTAKIHTDTAKAESPQVHSTPISSVPQVAFRSGDKTNESKVDIINRGVFQDKSTNIKAHQMTNECGHSKTEQNTSQNDKIKLHAFSVNLNSYSTPKTDESQAHAVKESKSAINAVCDSNKLNENDNPNTDYHQNQTSKSTLGLIKGNEASGNSRKLGNPDVADKKHLTGFTTTEKDLISTANIVKDKDDNKSDLFNVENKIGVVLKPLTDIKTMSHIEEGNNLSQTINNPLPQSDITSVPITSSAKGKVNTKSSINSSSKQAEQIICLNGNVADVIAKKSTSDFKPQAKPKQHNVRTITSENLNDKNAVAKSSSVSKKSQLADTKTKETTQADFNSNGAKFTSTKPKDSQSDDDKKESGKNKR